MTFSIDITKEHAYSESPVSRLNGIRNVVSGVVRFFLHFLEMTVAMMVGMVFLYLLDVVSPDTSVLAPYFEYGTVQFDIAMAIFMTAPMAAWMLVRRHDRRHVAEMAFGMNAPIVVIVVLRLLGAEANMPWLADASHPAMFLGMIIAMLFSRDHYTGKAGHSTRTAQLES